MVSAGFGFRVLLKDLLKKPLELSQVTSQEGQETWAKILVKGKMQENMDIFQLSSSRYRWGPFILHNKQGKKLVRKSSSRENAVDIGYEISCLLAKVKISPAETGNLIKL